VTLFRISDVVGKSPDNAIEIFDYQTPNTAHDIVFAKLSGKHDGGTNCRSTFTYAVKSGDVMFSINDEIIQANEGDVVTVPAGTRKILEGEVELFIVCSPPFNAADEN
jgi:mannose-6-phosphate isomerase-like protein (cupin superfamily)